MIGRLTGRVIDISGETVLLDVKGVGYEVHCPARVLAQISVAKDDVTLTIETVVREDLIRLFGFTERAERDWFRLLQSVQGVGAKVGLAILSILTPDDCAMAVAAQDHGSFAGAQGVGPKLAKRIVSELKDKAPATALTIAISKDVGGKAKGPASPARDAVSALTNLGYSETDARRAIDAALADDGKADVETLIRGGLKQLV